jgi:hypothetical protein
MASSVSHSKSILAAFAVLSLGLGACTGKKDLPQVYLLTGNCQIEVSTPHPEANVIVDGILIGQGRVSTSLPCGEKLVRVELKGYKPFRGFYTAESARKLLVPVKLEPLQVGEVYALSSQLIQDIREGKLAKGAVEGGASAAPPPDAGGGAAVAEEINWDDWS